MSHVISVKEELWAAQKARLAHLKLRELVRRHGVGVEAMKIVDQFANELFDESVRVADISEESLMDFLRAHLREREKQLQEDRNTLPKPLARIFESIGWIVSYKQFAAFGELKRIVGGL